MPTELQNVGAVFIALLGLAFGSFLNVVLARLPQGESIVTPASHCRNCTHTLSWWENIPLLSWLLLRGRCRQCHSGISPRYPLVECAVALLLVAVWIRFNAPLISASPIDPEIPHRVAHAWVLILGYAVFTWLLVALAALDAEHLWLPDTLTYSGIASGIIFTLAENCMRRFQSFQWFSDSTISLAHAAEDCLIAILAAAAIVLAIRLIYWLIRRKEGMGLGDAKLMAMLGAWLGLISALETFAVAILAATAAAVVWLAVLAIRGRSSQWAKLPLPLGTFLCLAALPEIFSPHWLWNWYAQTFLP